MKNTNKCSPKQYAANKFLLVRVARTSRVIRKTVRSKKLIRLSALADSLPRNAANGEIFCSYAERYLSMARPDEVSEDTCIVEGLGLAEYAEADDAVGCALL